MSENLIEESSNKCKNGSEESCIGSYLDPVEEARRCGFIALDDLVSVLAKEEVYNDRLSALRKEYQCDRGYGPKPTIGTMQARVVAWMALLNRWAFRKAAGVDPESLKPVPHLLTHYFDQETGDLEKYDSKVRSGHVPVVKLDDLRKYFTETIGIPLPPRLFPVQKWKTAIELIERWDIEGFELVNFCKKRGLQPYNRAGKKAVDVDSLKRKRKLSYEQILKRIQAEEGVKKAGRVYGGPSCRNWLPEPELLTEDEIKRATKAEYLKQPLDKPEAPEDCVAINFAIPSDEIKAMNYISWFLNDYRFKMDDVLAFEKEHNLLNDYEPGNSSKRPKIEIEWITANRAMRELSKDDLELFQIIEQAYLPAYQSDSDATLINVPEELWFLRGEDADKGEGESYFWEKTFPSWRFKLSDVERVRKMLEAQNKKVLDTSSRNEAKEQGAVNQEKIKKQNHVPIMSFYKNGQIWKLGKEGKEPPLTHLKGYEMIQFLLRHNADLAMVDVYNLGKSSTDYKDYGHVPEGVRRSDLSKHEVFGVKAKDKDDNAQGFILGESKQPIIDEKTADAATRKLDLLKEELDTSTDPLKKLEIKEEINKIENLLRNVKSGSEIRSFKTDNTENCRTTVQKNIKRALGTIHEQIPYLKEYLNIKTIITGSTCCYKPDPSHPVQWILDPPR